MKKVISAGHICLDITPVFPAAVSGQPIQDLLRPGKLLHMESADVHTGGSVANTGLALKLLGNEVELLGKIGKDALGTMVKSIVSSYGAGGLLGRDGKGRSNLVLALKWIFAVIVALAVLILVIRFGKKGILW